MIEPQVVCHERSTGIVYIFSNRHHQFHAFSVSDCVLSILTLAAESEKIGAGFIHSFIADIYIAPLQVGLLRALPTPVRPNNIVLSC